MQNDGLVNSADPDQTALQEQSELGLHCLPELSVQILRNSMIHFTVPPKVERIEGVPVLYQEEDLNLRCHVTGIPSPTIEWQKNRAPVRATQNGRISFPDEESLRIKFVTVEDTGNAPVNVFPQSGGGGITPGN